MQSKQDFINTFIATPYKIGGGPVRPKYRVRPKAHIKDIILKFVKSEQLDTEGLQFKFRDINLTRQYLNYSNSSERYQRFGGRKSYLFL